MDLVVTKEVTRSGKVGVSVQVTNTGTRDGDEVVQVYVRDVVASVTTPKIALKAFQRVRVARGATVTVRLEIDVAAQLKVLGRDMRFVVEPGVFNVFVGGSSANLALNSSFAVVRDGN